jgi:hypothetical protein
MKQRCLWALRYLGAASAVLLWCVGIWWIMDTFICSMNHVFAPQYNGHHMDIWLGMWLGAWMLIIEDIQEAL